MCFLKKELNACYNLISKIDSTGFFTSNYIRSWTTDPDTADNFAYFYSGSNKTIIEPKNCLVGCVISAVCYDNEGLDLRDQSRLKSSFAVNEYEIIMPPGSFGCVIISAVLLSNSTYYMYDKYSSLGNTRLLKSLQEACEKQNRFSSSEYKLVQIRDFSVFLKYLRNAE